MSIANENSTAQADANKAALVAASLLTPMQRIAEESANQAEFYQAAFTLVAKSARAKWGEVNFQQNGQMVSRTFLDDEKLNPQILLELTSTLAVESQVVNQPKSRVIQTGKSTFCLTTCPFTDEQGDSEGSATLFAQVADETVVTQFEDFLVACVEVMRNCCKRIQAESNADAQRSTREEIQLTALGKAAKFSDARELCFALTNSFCRKYNCQRTAIGLVQNMHIKLQSISGMDSFVENSPVVVDIRQAMEECYDHKNRIVIQHQNQNVGVQSDNFFLNKRLHEQTGGAAVCSVPIRSNGEVVGVLNLQRDLAEPFTEDEVKTLEESVEAYAPALEMLRKANKTVSSHVKEKAREKFQSTFFGSSRKRKIFGYAMAAAAIWFVLGYMPFSPKIPCTVQSQSAMKVSAPFDAVVASAPFGAGDKVRAGQVILNFDTKALNFESQSLVAQIKSYKVVRDGAIQSGNASEAAIAAAEIDVLNAQLAGVKKQISNASVVAPFDGTIIRGDLRQQIGQPVAVGTLLFEIASNDEMRVELAIPESTASYIEAGQDCKFVLASHPGSRLNCKIERVTPSTTSVDGRNVVMAEAVISDNEEWLQSGMEGVAKVKTGWQPVRWVTLRSILDRLRLGFWL